MIRFHLAEDTIDKTDIEELIGWLRTNPRLTKDKVTIQFEEKWNSFLGRKYSNDNSYIVFDERPDLYIFPVNWW